MFAFLNETNSEENKESNVQPIISIKPPLNYEEYIAMEKLNEWPQRITSEAVVSIKEELKEFGDVDTMEARLRDAARVDLKPLDDLEELLKSFEENLMKYANQIIVIDSSEDGQDNRLVEFKENTFIQAKRTKVQSTSEVLKSRVKGASQQVAGRYTLKENSMHEMKFKSVEYCEFLGYRDHEFTPLPGSLEAPQVLHRVSKAVIMKTDFRKIWKKIYLSDASVAILQDAFWWIFIDFYNKPDPDNEKARLFLRLADSFAALFFSINPEARDIFLDMYPEALSMALYSAYYETFPESRRLFDSDFKQRIINVVFEWITGGHPLPGSWRAWRIEILEKVDLPVAASRSSAGSVQPQSVAQAVIQAVMAFNDPRDCRLDMEGFERMVRQLGSDGIKSRRTKMGPVAAAVLAVAGGAGTVSGKSGGKQSSTSHPVSPSKSTPSQLQIVAVPQFAESSQMGQGAQFRRVLFDQLGRSPLIQQFLNSHSRRAADEWLQPAGSTSDVDQPAVDEQQKVDVPRGRLKRTEIAAILPPPSEDSRMQQPITYRQFLSDHQAHKAEVKRDYESLCRETAQEVVTIQKKTLDIRRQIERLQAELLDSKSPLELKVVSAEVLDKIDQRTTASRVGKQSDREKY